MNGFAKSGGVGAIVVQAIEHGYKEASRTIFEANVTHAIAGGIMLALGSGPVKGFAIVLLIGIATSVFTAVTFTRVIVANWVRRTRPTTSIYDRGDTPPSVRPELVEGHHRA